MNELDYDARQKKIIAQGARHKTGTRGGRKCTLPSDYLSKKEREALNGPVTEIRLNEPMDWNTFKGLSDTLKVEYIKHLQETWQANTSMLAEMFGCTPATVRQAMIRLEISTKRTDRITRGPVHEARHAAWRAFCNGVVGGGDNQPTWKKKVDLEPLEGDGGVVVQPEKKVWDLDSPDHVNAHRVPDPEERESKPFHMDMAFDGFPDELTMTILRNMFRDQNVRVRISAEVI